MDVGELRAVCVLRAVGGLRIVHGLVGVGGLRAVGRLRGVCRLVWFTHCKVQNLLNRKWPEVQEFSCVV